MGTIMQGDPSRFLEEIDEDCIILPQTRPPREALWILPRRDQFRQMPTGSAPRSFGRLASKLRPSLPPAPEGGRA